jgi:hypothetical protein
VRYPPGIADLEFIALPRYPSIPESARAVIDATAAEAADIWGTDLTDVPVLVVGGSGEENGTLALPMSTIYCDDPAALRAAALNGLGRVVAQRTAMPWPEVCWCAWRHLAPELVDFNAGDLVGKKDLEPTVPLDRAALGMPLPVACGHCGTEFIPIRSTARYCSAVCRARAHRRRSGIGFSVRAAD